MYLIYRILIEYLFYLYIYLYIYILNNIIYIIFYIYIINIKSILYVLYILYIIYLIIYYSFLIKNKKGCGSHGVPHSFGVRPAGAGRTIKL